MKSNLSNLAHHCHRRAHVENAIARPGRSYRCADYVPRNSLRKIEFSSRIDRRSRARNDLAIQAFPRNMGEGRGEGYIRHVRTGVCAPLPGALLTPHLVERGCASRSGTVTGAHSGRRAHPPPRNIRFQAYYFRFRLTSNPLVTSSTKSLSYPISRSSHLNVFPSRALP